MQGFDELQLGPLRQDVAELLENFDVHQLTAIAEFLTGTTELIYRHAALLRAESIPGVSHPAATGQTARSHAQTNRD